MSAPLSPSDERPLVAPADPAEDAAGIPAALAAVKAAGFRAVTVLRAYYEDSPEDAYLMQFRHVQDETPAALPASQIERKAG